MQGTVMNGFNIADEIASHYQGDGIVCDLPSMVYRLSNKHGVEPENIISNLYSSDYYGISDPDSYFEWLRKKNVTVWCFFGERGDPVRGVLGQYPGLLVNVMGEPRNGVYLVDPSVLDSLL